MRFDLSRAINDEEYARSLIVKKDVTYDDYIFIISVIYASNIDLNNWIKAFQDDTKLFDLLIKTASVEHCYNWDDAIDEIVDLCKLYNTKTEHRLNKESRDFVSKNISPILIQKLYETNKISLEDVINALNNVA